MAKGIMEASDFGQIRHEVDLDSGLTKPRDAAGGDGIGIGHADDHSSDAGLDEGVDTGWGATVVIAGFEGDPRRSFSSRCPGSGEGDDLGMRATATGGPAVTDPVSVPVGDDAAAGLYEVVLPCAGGEVPPCR